MLSVTETLFGYDSITIWISQVYLNITCPLICGCWGSHCSVNVVAQDSPPVQLMLCVLPTCLHYSWATVCIARGKTALVWVATANSLIWSFSVYIPCWTYRSTIDCICIVSVDYRYIQQQEWENKYHINPCIAQIWSGGRSRIIILKASIKCVNCVPFSKFHGRLLIELVTLFKNIQDSQHH